MNKLIGFEISKTFKNKSIYVCMLIAAALCVGSDAMIVGLARFFGGTPTGSAFSSIQDFSSNSMSGVMLSIMIPLAASEDHINETLKNIYARGFTRKDVYISKFITSMLVTLVFCAFAILVCGITGAVLYGSVGSPEKNFGLFVFANIVCLLGLASLYFMVTLVIGKAGISIAACVAGPQVVTMLLSMVGTLLSNKLKLDNLNLSEYWISYVSDSVVDITIANKDLIKYMGIAVVYMIVTTIVGIALCKRKEL